MAIISINNAMGGQTANFLDQYTWSGYTVTYSSNFVGPMGPCEGWAVNPGGGYQPGEPCIFYAMGMWLSIDPDTFWYSFDHFVNAVNGLDGLVYVGAVSMEFLPAGPPAPPDAPTDLAATDGTFETYSQVMWLDGGGSPATEGYSVYRDDVLVQSGITDMLPPTPEDATTYTLDDAGEYIEVMSATEVDVTAMPGDADAALYKDYGEDFFEPDGCYDFDFEISAAQNTSYFVPFALSNVLEDARYWQLNASEALWALVNHPSSGYLQLWYASSQGTGYINFSTTTHIWARVRWTAGSAVLKAYASEADRQTETNALGTSTIAVATPMAFRYRYWVNSYNVGALPTVTVGISDQTTVEHPLTYYYDDTGASSDEENPSIYYATATGDGGESDPSNEDTGWKSGASTIITKTVGPDYDPPKDFENLADWAAWAATVEATEHRAECYTGDLGPVHLWGPWMTGLITIYAAEGHQHDGTRDNTNCSRIVTSDGSPPAIWIRDLPAVRVCGIRFDIGTGGDGATGVYVTNYQETSTAARIEGCLFNLAGTNKYGIVFISGPLESLVAGAAYNNIVYGNAYPLSYGIYAVSNTGAESPDSKTMNVYILENTVVDCESPFRFWEQSYGGKTAHLNLWLMNNIGCRRSGSVEHDYTWTVIGGPWHGTIVSDHDCSSDGSADDKGGEGHLINQDPEALFVDWQSDVALLPHASARDSGRDLQAYFGWPDNALTDDAVHDVLWRPQGAGWDMGALELSAHSVAFETHIQTKTQVTSSLSGAHVLFATAIQTKTRVLSTLTGIVAFATQIETKTGVSSHLFLKRAPILSLVPGHPNTRRISWGSDQSRHWFVMADGVLLTETTGDHVDVDKSQAIREYLEIYDEIPSPSTTPLDMVRLDWVQGEGEQPDHYDVRRQKDGGAWAVIASVNGLTYTDGPLVDGVYDYTVTAVDADGNEAESAAAEVTISSAPEPPTDVVLTADEGSVQLSISVDGTESPSADFDHYNVYRSDTGEIDVRDGVYATPTSLPWETTEEGDGNFIYLVRAVDSGGIEESGITALVTLLVSGGAVITAMPCEPRAVTATATAGATITLKWLYNPRKEEGGPGAAHEARIYWDAGTGSVDFATPKATVAMSHPLTADWFSWQSEALVDETTYKFVVRIGSDAWPAGFETQNVDEHSATASTDTPTAPDVTAEIV